MVMKRKTALRMAKANARFATLCRQKNYCMDELRGKSRIDSLVQQRRVIAKALRGEGFSFPEIGWAMKRDHTSVQHMVKDDFRKAKNERCRALRSLEKQSLNPSIQKGTAHE